MLTLKQQQFDTFERKAFEAMLQRVESAVRQSLPARPPDSGIDVPDADVRDLVERSVERCMAIDIDRAPDLAAYVALGMALRDEAVNPVPDWLVAWLNRSDAAGPVKMAYVEATAAELGRSDPRWQRVTARVARARAAAIA